MKINVLIVRNYIWYNHLTVMQLAISKLNRI